MSDDDSTSLVSPLLDLASSPAVLTALVAVLVVSVLALRSGRDAGPLPGKLQRSGEVVLTQRDFGNEQEHMRDFGRAFAASAIYLWDVGATEPPNVQCRPLRPAAGAGAAGAGVEAVANEARKATLLEAINAKRTKPLPDAVWPRLVAQLTVNPGLAVLTGTGCPPAILQHKFVVAVGAGGELRVFTLGFVGTPMGGPRPDDKHAPFVLTIGSENLLAGAAAADCAAAAEETLSFTVQYAVQPARSAKKAEAAMRAPFLSW